MYFHEIKFKFNKELINKNSLNNIFKKVDLLLNVRFDENFNPYAFNNENIYEFKDITRLSKEDVKSITNHFLNLLLKTSLTFNCINF